MKKLLLYIVLCILAVLVLLPLFWMIITAFKHPGEGLKFNFFPKTKVFTSTFLTSNLLNEKDKTYVVFQYEDNSAQSVNIAGSFQGWDPQKNPLENNDGIWTIRINDIKEGEYEYKFIINGEWEKIDNRKINIKPGKNINEPLINDSYFDNNKLVFRYKNEKTSSSKLVINDEKIVEMVKDNEGYFTATLDNDESIKKYKFEYKRGFKEAFNSLYTTANFLEVWNNKDFPFAKFFWNSVVVSTLAAALTALICTMGGYAFAKKNFYGREKIFLLLMASMMIPGMIFMVPQFAIVSKFGWINSYAGLVIPHLANVFGIFLIRQYIKTIPNSLFEAATIDGASEIQIFRIIIIPLSLPIIATLFLLTFLGQWSNFLWQLIVNTPDSPYRTLPVGLALFKGQYAVDWTKIMAGACFSIVPIAILFLLAQRFFIEGMTGGAVKE
ncbi:ABC transporter permease subunit [Candidatus Dependentiae bacterium]|nr:ABC transporter permease subunit [Candidatus Dependentiae bacterium]